MSVVVTSKKKKGSGKGKWLPFVLVLGAVVGGGLWFWLGGDASDASNARQDVALPAVTDQGRDGARPSTAQSAVLPMPKVSSPKARQDVASSAVADDGAPSLGDDDVAEVVKTNKVELPKPMPYGVLSKQYFDNPVENRLEKLAIPGKGVAMILPNSLSDEEVMEILRRPIEISSDDSPDVIEAKERTIAIKKEAIAYIEQGGSYDEFVAELARVANEEANAIKTVRAEMMRILKSEGIDAADAYLEEVNPTLTDAGLKPIGVPKPLRIKYERERNRALEESQY